MNLNITDDIGLRNALVVTDGGEHTVGALIATVANDSPEDETVWIKGEGFSTTIDVEAGQAVRISPTKTEDGEETVHVTINNLPARPGELLDIQSGLTSAPADGKQWQIPVLAPDLPRYQTLTPTASATDDEGTEATATPTDSETTDGQTADDEDAEATATETGDAEATSTETADAEGMDDAEATATETTNDHGDDH